jgi:tripartite-type tricarboxylate transporter receptor subunit TctC
MTAGRSLNLISASESEGAKAMTEYLVQKLPARLEHPVHLEVATGGGGVPAAALLIESPSNRLTLGLFPMEAVVTRVLTRSTPYLETELKGFLLAWNEPYALMARAEAPFDNLQELADASRETPRTIGYAGPGQVSLPVLNVLGLAQDAGFKLQLVVRPALTAANLVTERGDGIDLAVASLSQAQELSGKGLKIVAVLDDDYRGACAPARSEQPGPQARFHNWTAIYGPRGLPEVMAAQALDAISDLLAASDAAAIMDKYCLAAPEHHLADAFDTEFQAQKDLIDRLGLGKD